MFDIGFWELALISILALVVIGPERLPKVARTAGHWFGKARRFVEGVKGEVENEFDTAELKRLLHNQEVQLKELQSKVNDEAADFRSGFSYNLDDESSKPAIEDDYLEFLDEDEEKDHEQIAAEKKLKEEKARQEQQRKEREFQNPAVAEEKPDSAADDVIATSNNTDKKSSG